MQNTIYFWKNGQVCTYHGYTDTKSIENTEFIGCFAVDTEHTEEMRYGRYNRKTGWNHIPLEKFPKKFRTHLLLLGVT